MTERSFGQRYRDRWQWDAVKRSTHCVDCYPGSCPYYVFLKDSNIVSTEQCGKQPTVQTGVPDLNPLGCQKGAAWHTFRNAPERILHPLKRAGERGEGKWEELSWEQALTEIADHMLDAIEEIGPEAIIYEGTPAEGGLMAGMPFSRIAGLLGAVRTDANANVSDASPGAYLTFGKYDPAIGMDDPFHAELIIYAHTNPVYTQIPIAHIAPEARYNGTEVVLIAPDCSPSHLHTDYHLPLRPATDAALAMGMAHVIVAEGLYTRSFVCEQTDLPLLVRRDDGRFLRECDFADGGREDQFFVWDSESDQPVPAPRHTLDLGAVEPRLDGTFSLQAGNGRRIEVSPAFALLRERLVAYSPERAGEICGVHPDTIRMLARKVASRRTTLLCGLAMGKNYHGDLMLRAYLLVLALTANWGRHGTGTNTWTSSGFDGPMLYGMKEQAGLADTAQLLQALDMMIASFKQQDPTMTDEMAHAAFVHQVTATRGTTTPPAFLWYHHWGYREDWNRREWNDASMTRPFDDYVREALDKGWWHGVSHPGEDYPPRVFLEVGGNALRRTRGGTKRLLRSAWPSFKCIVSVDWRMTTTGMFSDYVLPAAQHFEKISFPFPIPWTMQISMGDRIVAPPEGPRNESEIALQLAEKIGERARTRGLSPSRDSVGNVRPLNDFAEQYTLGGKIFVDEEQTARAWVADSATSGSLPAGTTLDTLREHGYVRFAGWGRGPNGFSQASDVRQDETHNPFRWHVEDRLPYPTLTRRAQFYIDHPWFLEADEHLPRHKDDPPHGGDHPFVLSSGHNRWSVHSMNITDRLMQQTHRGEPHVVINNLDAERLGIENGDEVEVTNDLASFVASAKISPSAQPGQVISYNGWEPYQYRSWNSASDLEPGMVKWLHFAGGYGHLKYRPLSWQPVPFDRGVRVNLRRVPDNGSTD